MKKLLLGAALLVSTAASGTPMERDFQDAKDTVCALAVTMVKDTFAARDHGIPLVDAMAAYKGLTFPELKLLVLEVYTTKDSASKVALKTYSACQNEWTSTKIPN